jgi:hypothetical protein
MLTNTQALMVHRGAKCMISASEATRLLAGSQTALSKSQGMNLVLRSKTGKTHGVNHNQAMMQWIGAQTMMTDTKMWKVKTGHQA